MIERQNYQDVKDFIEYRQNTLNRDKLTGEHDWSTLRHLLQWADAVPFPLAETIKVSFPVYLLTARIGNKDKPLHPETIKKICTHARMFFDWARVEHVTRYKSISERWIKTIYPPKSKGTQSVYKEHEAWSLESVLKVASMQPGTLTDRRDRAAICFLYLSGMRITAFTTLPAACVDIANRKIKQFPELGVETKNRKAAITSLLPIEELLKVVQDWDNYLHSENVPDCMWYAGIARDGNSLEKTRKSSKFGKQQALYDGMEAICKMLDIPYLAPHKLRHGHAVWAMERAKTPADLKAISQNLMHENIGITDGIYAILSPDKMAGTLAGMAGTKQEGKQPAAQNPEIDDMVKAKAMDMFKAFLANL